MRNSLKFLFVYSLIVGALLSGGCATDSGTLSFNPFKWGGGSSSSSGGGGGGNSSCGPGCNH